MRATSTTSSSLVSPAHTQRQSREDQALRLQPERGPGGQLHTPSTSRLQPVQGCACAVALDERCEAGWASPCAVHGHGRDNPRRGRQVCTHGASRGTSHGTAAGAARDGIARHLGASLCRPAHRAYSPYASAAFTTNVRLSPTARPPAAWWKPATARLLQMARSEQRTLLESRLLAGPRTSACVSH